MSWAFGFLILACFAGIVSLTGMAHGVSATIAWVLFLVFLVMMVVAAIFRVLREEKVP